MTNTRSKTEIINDLEKFRNNINIGAKFLQTFAVVLPASGILLSAYVGAYVNETEIEKFKGIALAASVSTTLFTTFKVDKKGKDLRDAYRYLTYSLYLYTVDGDFRKLVEAYKKTEDLVGHVEVKKEELKLILDELKATPLNTDQVINQISDSGLKVLLLRLRSAIETSNLNQENKNITEEEIKDLAEALSTSGDAQLREVKKSLATLRGIVLNSPDSFNSPDTQEFQESLNAIEQHMLTV